jgi:hypothetical protein
VTETGRKNEQCPLSIAFGLLGNHEMGHVINPVCSCLIFSSWDLETYWVILIGANCLIPKNDHPRFQIIGICSVLYTDVL